MIQRDYFMRMVEMLSTVLVRVLLNKEKRNYEEAEKEIETAAKTIVGLDLNIIGVLGISDVIKLMKTSDVYSGRCLISAELLKEYGDIFRSKENFKNADNFHLKALWLYSEALTTKEIPEPGTYFPKLNELLMYCSETEFPAEMKESLFQYFEMSGQYSKAEDILFELIDDDREGINKKAIAFYNRLKLLSDDKLVEGNLSREEVEESLEEITGTQH